MATARLGVSHRSQRMDKQTASSCISSPSSSRAWEWLEATVSAHLVQAAPSCNPVDTVDLSGACRGWVHQASRQIRGPVGAGGPPRGEHGVEGKLFLGGLDNATSKQSLLDYVSQWCARLPRLELLSHSQAAIAAQRVCLGSARRRL